jgi:hypothetical protein
MSPLLQEFSNDIQCEDQSNGCWYLLYSDRATESGRVEQGLGSFVIMLSDFF